MSSVRANCNCGLIDVYGNCQTATVTTAIIISGAPYLPVFPADLGVSHIDQKSSLSQSVLWVIKLSLMKPRFRLSPNKINSSFFACHLKKKTGDALPVGTDKASVVVVFIKSSSTQFKKIVGQMETLQKKIKELLEI